MAERKSPVLPAMIALVAVVAVLLMVVTPNLLGGDDDDKEPQPAAEAGEQPTLTEDQQAWEDFVRRDPDDPTAMGDVDAPVVMVAYSEFQCPYCGKFAKDTAPSLIDEYVEDGTLRIEWRDFPYLGEESTTAAHAARAAAMQDKFWEFHDAMYADQLPPNSGNLNEDYVAGIAEEIGLDVDRFREDMASDEVKKAVQRDVDEGTAVGVTGTPSFLVNGQPVVGAQPLKAFEQAIDTAAEQAPTATS